MTSEYNNSLNTEKKSKYMLIRIFWIVLGSIFVGIAAIGVVVPGLPTTPILILAAACYVRSSDRLYNWLIQNKYFGQYIKDYREGLGMPIKSKLFAGFMITLFVSLATLPFSPIEIANHTAKSIVLTFGSLGLFFISQEVPTRRSSLYIPFVGIV